MSGGLEGIDALIIATYACGMIALGAYCGLRQRSSDEYFVGNRAMNPFLIGVSTFATLFSTISYLSVPGEIINHGPVILTGTLAIPIVYLVVSYLLIPAYMRFRATSAYELLERQLGLSVRLTGATLFVLLRLVWMSTLVYFASAAMLTMLGLDKTWLPLVTAVTGGIAVAYSTLGGLRAVVVTDLLQFLLLFGGAVLVVATVTWHLGGFSWVPTQWNSSWDTQPLIGGPSVRVTVLGALLNGLLWWVVTAGGDQTAIQRFMATGSAPAARRSFLVNSLANVSVSVVLALVGFSLLAYFQSAGVHLPDGMSISTDADRLFPLYISHHLPTGCSGLVVSGMFAAAMSSVDSGVNSITAVVMSDYVERFRLRPLADRTRTVVSKLLALGVGVVVVSASSQLQHVPGNFLEISQRMLGLFIAPLFTLFFMALFVRGATQTGTIAGASVGVLTAATIAFWTQLADVPMIGSWVRMTGLESISFQWVLPGSLTTGILAGVTCSRLFPARSRDQ